MLNPNMTKNHWFCRVVTKRQLNVMGRLPRWRGRREVQYHHPISGRQKRQERHSLLKQVFGKLFTYLHCETFKPYKSLLGSFTLGLFSRGELKAHIGLCGKLLRFKQKKNCKTCLTTFHSSLLGWTGSSYTYTFSLVRQTNRLPKFRDLVWKRIVIHQSC